MTGNGFWPGHGHGQGLALALYNEFLSFYLSSALLAYFLADYLADDLCHTVCTFSAIWLGNELAAEILYLLIVSWSSCLIIIGIAIYRFRFSSMLRNQGKEFCFCISFPFYSLIA